ncbi:MAG: hypothetical protein JRI93_15380 [Deltaproteobacteria bacterium]|nr:hypothetical protein [Deltaproteobacteria bacterium]
MLQQGTSFRKSLDFFNKIYTMAVVSRYNDFTATGRKRAMRANTRNFPLLAWVPMLLRVRRAAGFPQLAGHVFCFNPVGIVYYGQPGG